MKVLIVEDELGCIVFMEKVLKPYSSEIFIAKSMKEAKQILRTTPRLDIICLDLRLPDSSSDETVDQIPVMKVQHPESTILVISGVEAHEKVHGTGAIFASKFEVFKSPAALLMAVWKAMQRKRVKGSPEYCKHIEMLEKFVTEQNTQEVKSDGMLM